MLAIPDGIEGTAYLVQHAVVSIGSARALLDPVYCEILVRRIS